tara:strand:- start:5289 stop:7745 length:2457 start_codon:yes stop_codon:yes gene_type:complete
MGTQRVHQNSFTRGEVDETLIARTDLGAFQQALKKARNVFCLNQGPIERRQGTLFRYDLGEQTRIEPFIFNENQEYIVAFQNTKCKIFSTNGTLLSSITGCIWTTAELFELTYTQQGDTMIITHKQFAPQVLTRTGATTFSIANFSFKVSTNQEKIYQPYFKFADDSITLDIDQTTKNSSVNIVASSPYFTSDYVGKHIRYHGTEIEITGYTSATELTGTLQADVRIELDDDPFKAEEGDSTVTVLHPAHGFTSGVTITVEGAEAILNEDGNGITAANLNGSKTITVLDDDRYTFEADNSDTGGDSGDGGGTNVRIIGHPPTLAWDEQVYSSINGFPSTCKFHQQRLFFGGGAISDFIAGSQSADFFNFDVGAGEDTDSIQISISSDQINEIRHLIAGKHLEVFTSTGEFYLKPQTGRPLTPADLRLERQSSLGCTQTCMPRLFDGAAIFIQPNGKTVREFFYNTATEDYVPTVITFLSPQAVSNPKDTGIIKSTGRKTEQMIIFANDDGTLGVFSAQRQEKLAGWVVWETDGSFESTAGTTSFLYTVVKRTINGATKYYLEQIANSMFALPTDCSVSKVLSSSYQPHGTILVNGTFSSTRQIVADGFTNAPTTGEKFKIGSASTEYTIQSVNSTGTSGEYIIVVDQNLSASDNASITFTTSRVFTGLNADPDLRGKIVHATSGSNEDDDIRYYGSSTVDTNGVAQFQLPASACDIGLTYTVEIETLPIDSVQPIRGIGSTYGLPRKIGKTILELSKTYNLQVNGNDVLLNDKGLQMVGYTGKKDIHTLGYTQTPNVSITQSVPVPMRIVAITSEVYY